MAGISLAALAGVPEQYGTPLTELGASYQVPETSLADLGNTFAQSWPGQIVANAATHLINIPQQAFAASENYRQGGDYNPAPIVEAAMLPMGTGAIAGLPLDAGEAALGAGFIRAYHGSPYDFDKFDLSKIGTGEGAQAYGHGLYFAENPQVAQAYRDNLTATQNAALRQQYPGGIDPAYESAAKDFLANGYSPADAITGLKNVYKNARPGELEAALQGVISGGRGRMYEVNINADPQQFLDWDKPIGQQPSVRTALADAAAAMPKARFFTPEPERTLLPIRQQQAADPAATGFGAYSALSRGLGQDKASALLNEAGIPGIKYLDQGSRAAGDGSRNYVVFNPQIIDIMKKYGHAAILGPAAARMIQNNDLSQ